MNYESGQGIPVGVWYRSELFRLTIEEEAEARERKAAEEKLKARTTTAPTRQIHPHKGEIPAPA